MSDNKCDCKSGRGLYVPRKAEVLEVIQETGTDIDIKTYRLKFTDNKPMDFMPGQFVEFSVPGIGEAPFGFASSPLVKDTIELTIKRTGVVTDRIHNVVAGDHVFIRGPLGNIFPIEKYENSHIFFAAGGLGLAPLRPLIEFMLADENRDKYKDVGMLFAARSSKDFVFKYDFDRWKKKINRMVLTIDREEENWDGRVGFPHTMVGDMEIDTENTYAILCGPPIMIKFMAEELMKLGLPKEKIYTTLEMRMSCGVGKCGKCNIGHQYVCVDGPVFNLEQLSAMPNEY
jgi:sulfhydrogenase subunit gamma (sulfur reductase)